MTKPRKWFVVRKNIAGTKFVAIRTPWFLWEFSGKRMGVLRDHG